MKLIIHRGTKEIGGSCVELSTEKSRILIDFGIPLTNDNKESFDSKIITNKSLEQLKALKILPDISGLYRNEKMAIDCILISHSHLDHYGLLRFVHPDIPIYMSEGAKNLIEISDIFIPCKIGKINSKIIDKGEKVKVGDFTIMGYLVDHSAFEALAFLISAEGKKLFYSGDFRAHGRKSSLFKKILRNPPKGIDYLLMEGTMLGRGNQKYNDETAIEAAFVEKLKIKSNIAFLFVSSQNIDRIVSAYRACLRTDTVFIIDIYTAFILYRLSNVSKRLPQFNRRNIRVKYFKCHADKLVEAGYKDLLYKFNKQKIELPEIKANKNRILMLMRDNSLFRVIVKKIANVKGAIVIYSMWEGYLNDKLKDFCGQKGISIEQIHTSGHATVKDLKDFANALNPMTLIPIHTLDAQKYPSLFKNVKILNDGEALNLV